MQRKGLKLICSIALVMTVLITCMSVSAFAETIDYHDPLFSKEAFPRIDGSTSMVPFAETLVSGLLNVSREEANTFFSFSRTSQAYHNLSNGLADIVIAAEPSRDVFEEMEQNDFSLSMEEIAAEALVFVVNAANPIDSLSSQQIEAIYSGQITNWAEVGGDDAPIVAFQRNPGSGSQVMMKKVMGDGLAAAPSSLVPTDMGGLIDAVRSFDGSANAIGYTVFYYAEAMGMADGLKILSIDGVKPTNDSIQSGAYPFVAHYYAAINASAPASSPERLLYDWLVTEEGQTLLLSSGYAPASSPEVQNTSKAGTENAVISLYTLTGNPTDQLTASPDYGKIYPYRGAVLRGAQQDSFGTAGLYGFYTHEGALITEPIFSSISKLHHRSFTGMDYEWVFVEAQTGSVGFCSNNGSFVAEGYTKVTAAGDYIVGWYSDNSFDVYNRDFRIVMTANGLWYPLCGYDGRLVCSNAIEQAEATCYAMLSEDGSVMMESQSRIELLPCGMLVQSQTDDTVICFDPNLSSVSFRGLGSISSIDQKGAFLIVSTTNNQCALTDLNGRILCSGFSEYQQNTDGSIFLYYPDKALYFPANGSFCTVGESFQYLTDGFVVTSINGSKAALVNLIDGRSTILPYGGRVVVSTDLISVTFFDSDSDTSRTLLLDYDLNTIGEVDSDIISLTDCYTQKVYLVGLSNDFSFHGVFRIFRENGEYINVSSDDLPILEDGFISCFTDLGFQCWNMNRDVVFSFPMFGLWSDD